MTLRETVRTLQQAGIEDSLAEARLLFETYGGYTAAQLLGADPTLDSPAFREALASRLAHIPLAYVIGETSFYGEVYRVTPAVLIPRPDTECLVEEAIRILPPGARFADLGTGSGCIAVSVLSHRPDTVCDAYDISEGALSLARENAERNGVGDRITCRLADILSDPLASPCDAILSNPPYIRSSVLPTLSEEVRHEPVSALNGGEDGMLFYRAILSRHAPALPKDAPILFEIGYDQGEDIARLADRYGYACRLRTDYGGRDRVAILYKRAEKQQ